MKTVLIVLIGVVILGGLVWYAAESQNQTPMTNQTVDAPSDYDLSNSPTTTSTPPMGTTNISPTSSEAMTSSPVTTQAVTSLVIKLGSVNDSGQTGTATLTESNGKVTVKIMLTGTPTGSDEPAHIHTGQCPDVGDVKYPLANVKNGQSTTQINATIAQLQNQLPLAINVHKSAAESKTYTACGDLIF